MKIFPLISALILAAATARSHDRLPTIPLEQMTPAQAKVAQEILAGPRKSLDGPFNAWLRSPELADRLQKVGEYLRFHSSLPPRLNEFAILITARHWTSQYEWFAHYPLAIKAGLNPQVAADLAAGRKPAAMQPDEAMIYDFSTQLHRDMQVTDATYKAVAAKFGEQGAVDLIALNGYYDLVSMTLNTAKVGLPEGERLPLKVIRQ